MSDMFDSGACAFNGWNGEMREFWSRWLGPFNPDFSAEKANEILHEGKITGSGQMAFIRGWKDAQSKFYTKTL